MISWLNGRSAGMDDDGAITVMCGSVGYRVVVNDRDREIINVRGRGAEIELFCRSRANENDITVYGFLEVDDRRAFDKLVRVDGVGPATALRLLSVHDAGMLRTLINTARENENSAIAVKPLLALPNIGKKMAKKLVDEVHL